MKIIDPESGSNDLNSMIGYALATGGVILASAAYMLKANRMYMIIGGLFIFSSIAYKTYKYLKHNNKSHENNLDSLLEQGRDNRIKLPSDTAQHYRRRSIIMHKPRAGAAFYTDDYECVSSTRIDRQFDHYPGFY